MFLYLLQLVLQQQKTRKTKTDKQTNKIRCRYCNGNCNSKNNNNCNDKNNDIKC